MTEISPFQMCHVLLIAGEPIHCVVANLAHTKLQSAMKTKTQTSKILSAVLMLIPQIRKMRPHLFHQSSASSLQNGADQTVIVE